MDSIKNYFKSGKPEPRRPSIRRMSVRQSTRLSGVPSTIEEGSPVQEFTTFESLGQERKESQIPDIKVNPRFSRFSFISNVTQESTAEEIEEARQSFRKSLSGYRKSSWIPKAEGPMEEIAESAVEEMSYVDEKEEDEVNMLDELKHEIMVNYLFQQQCARLWIADGTGEVEGVMLRKSRGNYLACPPALADSIFADSCVELNVQVGICEACTSSH